MIDDVLNQREKTHGSFVSNGQVIQEIKDWLRTGDNYSVLQPYQKEALDMIAHKMGRIVNGSENIDHWVDICGYSKLVVNEFYGVE